MSLPLSGKCLPALLVLLALARGVSAAEGPPPSAPVKAPTLVIIQSDPPGANIAVDGVASGRAPAALEQLTPGKHHVVATLEDYGPAEQDIEVKAQETTSIHLTLPQLLGTLKISSTETVECTLGAIKLRIAAGEVPLVKVPAGPLSIHCEGEQVLPVNQSVRITGDQVAQIALAPTRLVSSDRIRVESPDSRPWELRSGTGQKLCALPCTVTWAGKGMSAQLSSDLTTVDRETKALPDELPFLPAPGTAVQSVWNGEHGNLAHSIIGLSLSVVAVGAAIPLCVLTTQSESGNNVAAGVGCVSLAALGGVGGILSTITLVTYSPGHWSFTAVLDAEQKSEGEPKDDYRWSFALDRGGAAAKLAF